LNATIVSSKSDFDGGTYWQGVLSSGKSTVLVTIDSWSPWLPGRASIASNSSNAVTKTIARLWPDSLTVEKLLENQNFLSGNPD
jgi:hypothetical protein